MPVLRPFRGVRPAGDKASDIAALPYDVYNREEAKRVVERNPLSFLKIDRAETQFPDETDLYSQEVYERAGQTLKEMICDGSFVRDEEPCFYLYALTFHGRTQTGIVGCAAVDDYLSGAVRKHENTKEDKEKDRIRHVDACNAQTGPIFLAYRSQERVRQILAEIKTEEPEFAFTAEDGVRHAGWRISDEKQIQALMGAFENVSHIYIADGHHRAASAVRVGQRRREAHPGYDGTEEFNYFLSVLFPDDELRILDYNRVVKDLNGLTMEEFLGKVSEKFDVLLLEKVRKPEKKGQIIMYLHGYWFRLTIKDAFMRQDPVEGMDVAYLQRELLEPVLGINDPKTDERVDFVGGIRGMEELKRRADEDMEVAFAMYPTSIQELFEVADAGLLMPPKSTWFEPKLRSGLFIHEI